MSVRLPARPLYELYGRNSRLPTASLIKNKTHHRSGCPAAWLVWFQLIIRSGPRFIRAKTRSSNPQPLTHRISCVVVTFSPESRVVRPFCGSKANNWREHVDWLPLLRSVECAFFSPFFFLLVLAWLFLGPFFLLFMAFVLFGGCQWLCHKIKYEYVRK